MNWVYVRLSKSVGLLTLCLLAGCSLLVDDAKIFPATTSIKSYYETEGESPVRCSLGDVNTTHNLRIASNPVLKMRVFSKRIESGWVDSRDVYFALYSSSLLSEEVASPVSNKSSQESQFLCVSNHPNAQAISGS